VRPAGGDAYILRDIIHDNDESEVERFLRAVAG